MTGPIVAGGPAARAVLEEYHRRLAAHRRRVVVVRAVTVLLVLWTLAGVFVAPALALANGAAPFWAGIGIPVGITAVWLTVRNRIADALGTRGEPAFPQPMLDLAVQQDAGAVPREFGSVPESMRTYHPEHW